MLPAGFIVRVNGYPCRLTQDTQIVNATITGLGLDEFLKRTTPRSGGGVTTYGINEPLRSVDVGSTPSVSVRERHK